MHTLLDKKYGKFEKYLLKDLQKLRILQWQNMNKENSTSGSELKKNETLVHLRPYPVPKVY